MLKLRLKEEDVEDKAQEGYVAIWCFVVLFGSAVEASNQQPSKAKERVKLWRPEAQMYFQATRGSIIILRYHELGVADRSATVAHQSTRDDAGMWPRIQGCVALGGSVKGCTPQAEDEATTTASSSLPPRGQRAFFTPTIPPL